MVEKETHNALTVSEISSLIKQSLEDEFSNVSVVGEISNFKAHYSGHWYFTLKDASAQINCTMWKGLNSYVFFKPQDGMKVIISGRVTVYPPRGNYQIDIRSMKPAGEGELQAAFERLKKKLAAEGLFDEVYKKPIPEYPNRIGIVTAINGAAFQDMISVAKRRYPLLEIIIASSKVQGEGAAEEIALRIQELNKLPGIDLLIVGRGGGSLEDLWAFNEEIVARAIFNSSVPVISAVGHEIDFTISDFAADLRAPTPSAAMELATPDINEIFAFINEFPYTFAKNMDDIINVRFDKLNSIKNSYGFRTTRDLVKNRSQFLDNLFYKFDNTFSKKILKYRTEAELLSKHLESFDTNRILKKGFALVKQKDKFIKRAAELDASGKMIIKFFDNEITLN